MVKRRLNLATTAVFLGTATAVAVPMAATAAAASPAPAPVTIQVERNKGKRCAGLRAVRCAWLNLDRANNKVRGYGSVKDTTGGRDFVAVQAFLEYKDNRGRWVRAANGARVTGYDKAQSRTGLAGCVRNRWYRTKVNWNWNNSERGTIYSKAVNVGNC